MLINAINSAVGFRGDVKLEARGLKECKNKKAGEAMHELRMARKHLASATPKNEKFLLSYEFASVPSEIAAASLSLSRYGENSDNEIFYQKCEVFDGSESENEALEATSTLCSDVVKDAKERFIANA